MARFANRNANVRKIDIAPPAATGVVERRTRQKPFPFCREDDLDIAGKGAKGVAAVLTESIFEQYSSPEAFACWCFRQAARRQDAHNLARMGDRWLEKFARFDGGDDGKKASFLRAIVTRHFAGSKIPGIMPLAPKWDRLETFEQAFGRILRQLATLGMRRAEFEKVAQGGVQAGLIGNVEEAMKVLADHAPKKPATADRPAPEIVRGVVPAGVPQANGNGTIKLGDVAKMKRNRDARRAKAQA